jgi:type IV pilus assembly protein PilB
MAAIPRSAFAVDGVSLPDLADLAHWWEVLEPQVGERALVIGDGTGYVSAMLAALGCRVHAVERVPERVTAARERIDSQGPAIAERVQLRHGDGAAGWREAAPFDLVLFLPHAQRLPDALLEQLAPGGRLVAADPRPRHCVSVLRQADGRFVRAQHCATARPVRLGDLLVAEGVARREDVERAAGDAARTHRHLAEVLLEETASDENAVYRVLAAQRGLAFGEVEVLLGELDLELVRAVPRAYLHHVRAVPIRRADGVVRLATSDPDVAVSDVAKAFGTRALDVRLVTPTGYRRLWAAIELAEDAARREQRATPVSREAVDLLAKSDVDAHFIALFEALLLDAIGERASDIHLEQYGERVRVRLRIDGELREVPRYRMTPDDLRGVVNVVKVAADLDIAERRRPQGGRMRRRAGGHVFDLRVQTQPSLYAEHLVIRLLPQDTRLLTIEDLGLSKDVARELRRLLEHPSGLVLVVGPTGSGKSTTLYAGLQILAADGTRKVITVEDPIEYAIEGVQQTQVNPDIGFAFADAMRAFVREDPDVILVGEIRDGETALEAIRASQTGHLVLSTLHCNDTVDAVQRLVDLGMHRSSIASELLAVLSQRLAKRICEGCRVVATPSPELLAEIFPRGVPEGFRSFRGAGCERCRGRGTYGRVAVVELLSTGAELRKTIARGVAVDELREAAVAAGLRPLRRAALELVAAGTIALDELRDMLSVEHMAG